MQSHTDTAVYQETHGWCCYPALNSHMATVTWCGTYICHPRHRPVCRSSGTTRTCHRRLCRFWLGLPPLPSSFSTVKLFRLSVSHLQRSGSCSTSGGLRASLSPRRGQWLESIADCNVSQINNLRNKVIKQSAAKKNHCIVKSSWIKKIIIML